MDENISWIGCYHYVVRIHGINNGDPHVNFYSIDIYAIESVRYSNNVTFVDYSSSSQGILIIQIFYINFQICLQINAQKRNSLLY